ncbi:expressed protein [Echinococcus multilocularis]|uniref:Expressed protein n=1 Tax=Echinococcus multilocularis TaxID=6211 RepID=A0A068XUT2_ECHMU|nr:expressed protein [Echinococcus multilocularis]
MRVGQPPVPRLGGGWLVLCMASGSAARGVVGFCWAHLCVHEGGRRPVVCCCAGSVGTAAAAADALCLVVLVSCGLDVRCWAGPGRCGLATGAVAWLSAWHADFGALCCCARCPGGMRCTRVCACVGVRVPMWGAGGWLAGSACERATSRASVCVRTGAVGFRAFGCSPARPPAPSLTHCHVGLFGGEAVSQWVAVAAAGGDGGARSTWLILPVVICLSQRLSHACLSSGLNTVRPRMAH